MCKALIRNRPSGSSTWSMCFSGSSPSLQDPQTLSKLLLLGLPYLPATVSLAYHLPSMTAVLTTSMTLRIVLSVRGTLASGGSFAGSTTNGSSRTTHVISTSRTNPTNISSRIPGTYTLDEMRGGVKSEVEWDTDGKSSVHDSKVADIVVGPEPKLAEGDKGALGVKITIDQQVEYDETPYGRRK
jgi:hypothetical protein